MSQVNNQSIARFNLGSIAAAVWERTTSDGSRFYKATIETRFQDRDGNWRSSNSYSLSELVLLAKISEMAQVKIRELEADIAMA